MKLKVEAGADFLITQLFFDNRFYFDLVARTRAAGIKLPIVPGLMPVPSRRSLATMTAMSGATVPSRLALLIDEQPDDEAIRKVGVQHCIAQCAELLERGAPGLHFYTFNRARGPMEILAALRGQQLLAS
jgi:methylenetetrahydrofolate reductase (NADPH)